MHTSEEVGQKPALAGAFDIPQVKAVVETTGVSTYDTDRKGVITQGCMTAPK